MEWRTPLSFVLPGLGSIAGGYRCRAIGPSRERGLEPSLARLWPSCVGPWLGSFPSLRPRRSSPMVVTVAPSPFCSPEEDPLLLLQSTVRCVERILQRSAGRPLRRTLLEFLYGEEGITLLEEVIPAIQQHPQRLDALRYWPPLADLRGAANQQAAAGMRQ